MDYSLASTPIKKPRDPAAAKLLKSKLKFYSSLLEEKKINKIRFEGEIRSKIVEEIKESGILSKKSQVLDDDFNNALNTTRGEIIRLVESVRQPETDKTENQILEANLKKCEEEMNEVKRKLSLTEFELFEMKMSRKSQACNERILRQLKQLRKENAENREFIANLHTTFTAFKEIIAIPDANEILHHKIPVVKSPLKAENQQNTPNLQFSYRSSDIFSSRGEMDIDLGDKPETTGENSPIPLFKRIRENSGIYSAGKCNRNDSGMLFYTAGTSHKLQNVSNVTSIIKDSIIIQKDYRREETETNCEKNDGLDQPKNNSGIFSMGKNHQIDTDVLSCISEVPHSQNVELQNASLRPIIEESQIIRDGYQGLGTQTNNDDLYQSIRDNSSICSAIKSSTIDSILLSHTAEASQRPNSELLNPSCLMPMVDDTLIVNQNQSGMNETDKDGSDSMKDHSPVFVSKTRNFGQTLSPSCDFMAKKSFFESLVSPKPSENEDNCSTKSIDFGIINDMEPSVHSPRVGDVFDGVHLSEISVPAGCQSEQCFDATIHANNPPNVQTPSKSVNSLREIKMTTFPVHSPANNNSLESCATRHYALESSLSALTCDFETLKRRFEDFLVRHETEKESQRDVEVSRKQHSLTPLPKRFCSPKDDTVHFDSSNQHSTHEFRESAHRSSSKKSSLNEPKESSLQHTITNPDLTLANQSSANVECTGSPIKSNYSKNSATFRRIPSSTLNSSEKPKKKSLFEDDATENKIGPILKEARECAVSLTSVGPCEEAVTTSLMALYHEEMGQFIIDYSDAGCNELEEDIDDSSSGSTVMSRVIKRRRNATLKSKLFSLMSPLKKQRKTEEKNAPKHKYKLRSNKYSDYDCTTSNLYSMKTRSKKK